MKLQTKRYPDIELDMQLIARERIRQLKEHGHIPPDNPEPAIAPFKCLERAYLCSGGKYLMMIFPGAVDVELCADAIVTIVDGVIEYWVLEDDRVTDYSEFVDASEDHATEQ